MDKQFLIDSLSVISSSKSGNSSLGSLLNSLAIRGKFGWSSGKRCNIEEFIAELEVAKRSFSRGEGQALKRKAKADIAPSLGFDLPNGWGLVSLEDICFAQAGYAFSSDQFNSDGNGIPLIRIRDIDKGHSETFYSGQFRPEFLVQNGDWLVGMDGNFNVRQWQGETALLNQRVTRLIFFDERVNQKFVSLALEEHLHSLMGTKSYTTVDHLSTKQIDSTPIPLPCIEEQEWIISQLADLTTALSALHESQESLGSLGQAARKSSMDTLSTAQTPMELQIAWERIQENWSVFTETSESIKSIRELVLDVLFKPKQNSTWALRCFDEVLTLSNGDRSKNYPSKEHRVSSGVPFVNAGHLRNGKVDLVEMDYITNEKYESLRGGKFKDGDVLFCLRGSLGKSALVKGVGAGTVASSLAILRVGQELSPDYLYWFLQSGLASVQIRQHDNGTAQPNLAAKSVLKFQIPLPDINEQNAIVAKVSELMRLCDQLQQAVMDASDKADRFTRSLLPA